MEFVRSYRQTYAGREVHTSILAPQSTGSNLGFVSCFKSRDFVRIYSSAVCRHRYNVGRSKKCSRWTSLLPYDKLAADNVIGIWRSCRDIQKLITFRNSNRWPGHRSSEWNISKVSQCFLNKCAEFVSSCTEKHHAKTEIFRKLEVPTCSEIFRLKKVTCDLSNPTTYLSYNIFSFAEESSYDKVSLVRYLPI